MVIILHATLNLAELQPKIIHKFQLEPYTYIRLPNIDDVNLLYGTVIKLFNLNGPNIVDETKLPESNRFDRRHIKLLTQLLSITPGFHQYRMELSQPRRYILDEVEPYCSVYFAYDIIDDNPVKPYIYVRSNKNVI